MNTWLEHFHENTPLNKYRVAFRSRSGIGYRLPNGSIQSSFVGYPIHYRASGEWKPVTLAPMNGKFEGVDFEWKENAVFYKGRPLFQPRSITFNGKKYPLAFSLKGNRLIADVPGIGIHEIVVSENGVREIFTIPDPLEGELSFQVDSREKPSELKKGVRRIIGSELEGDVYQLTKDMAYPIEIDPDYLAYSADGYLSGFHANYAAARCTVDTSAVDVTGAVLPIGQFYFTAYAKFMVHRAFMKFNTSGIPDSDPVHNVKMYLTMNRNTLGDPCDVIIKRCNWSAYDPLVTTNAALQAAMSCLQDNIWQHSADVSLFTSYPSGSLSTSWVNPTGATYYSIVTSEDEYGIEPTILNSRIQLCTQDHATVAWRPYLSINHGSMNNNYVLFS